MANELATINGPSAQFQTDLWQLGRLTGAGLATDNNHLMRLQGILNQLSLTRYWQFFRKADF